MICVFVGPTLAVDEARRLVDATFLPPVARGDVLRAVELGATTIGIIDGYFDSVPSVWHKEILVAMERGVHVFGTASMGALRAAELDRFGMVGVGRVYEWYRDGLIDSDDEVAVAHGPSEFGFRRLSDALVDIRFLCGVARDADVIPTRLADLLVTLAQADHYVDRTVRRTVENGRLHGADEGQLSLFESFARQAGPLLKERDARELLTTLAGFSREDHEPHVVDYSVERTVFLERLEHELDLERARTTANGEVRDASSLGLGEPIPVLRKKMLLRLLARSEAARIALGSPTDEELQDAADDFRRGAGLLRQADTEQWAAEIGVTNETFVEFMRDAVTIAKLERLYSHRLDAGLAGQLRMSTADGWLGRTTGHVSGGAEIEDRGLGNEPHRAGGEQAVDRDA